MGGGKHNMDPFVLKQARRKYKNDKIMFLNFPFSSFRF